MRRRTLLALLPAVAWTTRAGAEDDVDRLLRDVDRAREKLRTLTCAFTQERVLGLLATTVTSKGGLTLLRPDRLRWELSPPDEIVYWVTPEGVAYRTPRGSGKVDLATAGALAAVLGDLMILLGGDLSKLRDRYVLAVERPKAGPTLRLTPKDERVGKLIRRISAVLPADLVFPRRIVLEEPSDDRTTLTFDPPQINPPVDPARMRPS